MPEGGVVAIQSPFEGGVSQSSIGLHMIVVFSGNLAGVDDILLYVASTFKWARFVSWAGTGTGKG